MNSTAPEPLTELLARVALRDHASRGYDLFETALAEFAMMWSDLMQLTIVPVLEDAALAEVLNRVEK